MQKRFKIRIGRGGQLLESPDGELVPRITYTRVSQEILEPGVCEFEAWVNAEGQMVLDQKALELKMPGGEVLPVEILSFFPKKKGQPYDKIRVKCVVVFPYDTHKNDTTGSAGAMCQAVEENQASGYAAELHG